MIHVPILRSQTDELAEIRRMMRDPSGESQRWSDDEIYDAINLALTEWHGRVQIPRFYENDFTTGTYEYSIPDYIDTSNMDVQSERTIWGIDIRGDTWDSVWAEVPAWNVIPGTAGDQTLVIENLMGSVDGRIIWYDYNGPIPRTLPTTNAEIDDDDTSVVLASVVTDIGRAGYIKIGSEWMSYAGVSDDGSNTTLSNLVRGLDYTSAATQAAGSTVMFGIAVPEAALWSQLFDQVAMRLHRLPLTGATPNESEQHERMLGYQEQRVEKFWRNWIPIRPPKMRLSRLAMGEPTRT